MMRPPTNYLGSKSRLAPWIASLLPTGRTYVEPFAGSAAVLFHMRPWPTEIINDLDGNVACFYRVLRDQPDALHQALRLTPYSRHDYQTANPDQPGLDDLERARRWYLRVNQSISHMHGVGRPAGWAAAFNTNGADHAHKFASLVDRLPAAAERLRRVHLEHRPAVQIIAKFDHQATVFYCDPPYLDSTVSARTKRRGGADYNINYASPADHRELASVLHACKGAVLLSGYPSALYEELYAGWWRVERAVSKPSTLTSGGRAERAVEVIWSNRPLREQLQLTHHQPEEAAG